MDRKTTTLELPTTPKRSFNKYEKICPHHTLKVRNRYLCRLTEEACNKINCPIFNPEGKGKKINKEHKEYRIPRRYRGAF